jgi:hypothetical protein
MTPLSRLLRATHFNVGWPLLVGVLAFIAAMPARAITLQPVEITAPFEIGPILPDPTRNLVYFVDATYNRILAVNTVTGVQVAATAVDDGVTEGGLAISVNDNTLYLSESNYRPARISTPPTSCPKGSSICMSTMSRARRPPLPATATSTPTPT